MRRGTADWREAAPAAPYVWPATRRFGATPVSFEGQFEDPVPAIGVALVRQGTVAGEDGWTFDRKGRLLADLSWYGRHVAELVEQETVHRPGGVTRSLDGTTLSLATTWGSHFGHFVGDSLARIAVYLAAGLRLGDVDHVVLPAPPGSPAARALLDATGIPASRLVPLEPGAVIRAEALQAPTLPGARRQYLPLAADYLRALHPPGTGRRRLFVTRRGYERNPLELERLEGLAVARGFEVYDPMASTDQAADFADAEAVIGVSGSALTNLVFCRPGAKVVEIFSDAHLYGYYYSLSGAAGLRYGYLVGSSDDEPRSIGASLADFSIDADAFAAALDWLADPAD